MGGRTRRLAMVLACVLAACGARTDERTAQRVAQRTAGAATRPDQAPQLEAKAPGASDFAPPDAQGYGRAAGLVYFEEIVGDASASDALPLLVLLHGRGDAPSPSWLPLRPPSPVRVVMPRAQQPHGKGFSWFTYRAAEASEAQLARGIAEAAERVARAIAVLRERRPTVGAPIVGGFSQGGMLSYAVAVRHPALVRLALPIGGLLPEPLWPSTVLAKNARAPKIRAAHGTLDSVVPFERARATAAALAQRGYDVTLLEEDGVAHSISPRMIEMLNGELASALRDGR